MVFSPTSARAAESRLRRALMYPPPATSNLSNPSGTGMSATTSSAILRGALRSCFANSNENGMANSPISTLGGWSITMLGRSIWYFRRRNSRTWLASCFWVARYTVALGLSRSSEAFRRGLRGWGVDSQIAEEKGDYSKRQFRRGFDAGDRLTYDEGSHQALRGALVRRASGRLPCALLTSTAFPASAATCSSARWWTRGFRSSCCSRRWRGSILVPRWRCRGSIAMAFRRPKLMSL